MRPSVKQYLQTVRTKISISTECIFVIAVAFLLVPIHWLCAWLLAVCIHELCHYACLKLFGARVHKIHIGHQGVIMQTDPLPLEKEALCAYAGPLGALAVFVFARQAPRTAICTLVFSAYNLLPVFPLDGGRGLGCLLRKMLPEEKAAQLQKYIEATVLIGILIIALYAVIRLGLGILPAAIAALLFWRAKGIKIPCKKRLQGLQ